MFVNVSMGMAVRFCLVKIINCVAVDSAGDLQKCVFVLQQFLHDNFLLRNGIHLVIEVAASSHPQTR